MKSREAAAALLHAWILKRGGHVEATGIGQFYAAHPAARAAIGKGKLKKFVDKHPHILRWSGPHPGHVCCVKPTERPAPVSVAGRGQQRRARAAAPKTTLLDIAAPETTLRAQIAAHDAQHMIMDGGVGETICREGAKEADLMIWEAKEVNRQLIADFFLPRCAPERAQRPA